MGICQSKSSNTTSPFHRHPRHKVTNVELAEHLKTKKDLQEALMLKKSGIINDKPPENLRMLQ